MNTFKGSLRLLGSIFFILCLNHTAYSQNIVTVLENTSSISSFARAVKVNGLDSRLNGTGPFTVFAPSNAYFNKEVQGKELKSEQVKKLLLNHIMTGYASARNLKMMQKITTLGGITLTVHTSGGLKIGSISLAQTNIKASNGVIHIINGVLK